MLGEIIMYDPLMVPIVLVFFGFALAFHGRKLIPVALVLISVAAGFMYGGALISSLSDDPDLLKWAPVILGVVTAVLVSLLYRFAFFAAGAVLGFVLASLLFPESPVVIRIIAAVAGGGLVYLFRNVVFSVLTAVFGGILLASGSVNLLAWAGVSAGKTAYTVIMAGTVICGFVYQMRRGRKS